MTSPQKFKRSTWDLITRSQLTAPAQNERGVMSRDEVIQSRLGGDYLDVPVRIYEPVGLSRSDEQPVLVFFHGGGFCIQNEKSKQSHDMVVELVHRLGFRAVSVGYRLAPEHPFPCGLRDAYTVLSWLHLMGNSSEAPAALSPECSQIMLGGDSAGANLSLVLALLALNKVDADCRPDEACAGLLDKIIGLLLVYPGLFEAPSEPIDSRPVYMIPHFSRSFFVRSYLEDRQELLQDWRVAPLRAPTLCGLPPTMLVSAALDPLCDSNRLLVEALIGANVRVYHKHVEAAPHGFLSFPRFATDVDRVNSTFDWLESAVKSLAEPV